MCTEVQWQAEKIGSPILKRDMLNSMKVALWKELGLGLYFLKNAEFNCIAYTWLKIKKTPTLFD